MLRRAAASLEIDASDVVIGGALVLLFIGVAGKFDAFTAFIAVAVATLVLVAIGLLVAR